MQGTFNNTIFLTAKRGFTLIEIILVLAVIALIMIFSIRQYQSWQIELDYERVDYNVDALFQAMQFYYQAQCYGTYNPNQQNVPYPPITPGTLNPGAASGGTTITFPVDIQNYLITTGYLSTPYPFAPNNFVDASDPPATGYTANYIIKLYPRVQAEADNSSGGNIALIGQTWMQVGVKLKTADPAIQMAYLRTLGGTCLASTADATCDTMPGTGSYVVWLRKPSFASAKSRSDYWASSAIVTQFTQLYTTYPITYLTGMAQSGSQPLQTILCGS